MPNIPIFYVLCNVFVLRFDDVVEFHSLPSKTKAHTKKSPLFRFLIFRSRKFSLRICAKWRNLR